jgi:XTP/dITP diphosphohydrolase
MDKILVATKNKGKIREIQELLKGLSIDFLSLDDVHLDDDVIEDGNTFEDNAVKKSRYFAKKSNLPAIADDSGICIDALDGKPGVYSARYGGPLSNKQRREKILQEMEGVPEEKRTAQQVCVIALTSNGVTHTFKGIVHGIILKEMRGDSGFSYDPIFFYPPRNCTFAELSRTEKNQVSHRGEAIRKLAAFLKRQ